MPNWCFNKLVVSGKKSELDKFKNFVYFCPDKKIDKIEKLLLLKRKKSKSEALCFDKIIPKPKEIINAQYDPIGYNWEILNWGCKWGAVRSELTKEKTTSLHYSFETPWAPPIPVLQRMSEQFPALNFRLTYKDEGHAFKGVAVAKNGKTTDNSLQ